MAGGEQPWALAVKTVAGSSITLVGEQSTTVGELRTRLAERHLLASADPVRVLFAGRLLDDELYSAQEVYLASADAAVLRKNRQEALRYLSGLLATRVHDTLDREVLDALPGRE